MSGGPLIWVVRKIFGKLLMRRARRSLRGFLAATAACRDVQLRVLLEKLARNAASGFGRDHDFAHVRNISDFRRRVPVTRYDYYQPYLERVKQGQWQAMFGPGQKLHMFALTSGTSDKPKHIPVTDAYLKEYRRGWLMWGIQCFDTHPRLLKTQVLQVVSDWEESHAADGTPCGAVSGLTASMQTWLVRRRYCTPPCLAKIPDAYAKYYTALRLALPCPVGMVTSANPSTLVSLARLGDREKQTLLRDLADGTLDQRFEVPRAVRDQIRSRIRKRHRTLAAELERIVHATGALYPKDYWPTLTLLANWTGGTVGAYLQQFPQYWGDVPVRDIGLIASEGRMTIPLEDGTPAGLLDINHHFFEFIPESEIDSDHPTVLEPHELEAGKQYFILLTTSSGLYRYNIHDVVRCVAMYQQTPMLEFLNKGTNFSSLTGEKISEFQVAQAVDTALRERRVTVNGFTLAPVWAETPYYALLVDQSDVADRTIAADLAWAVDSHLAQLNMEYQNKRATRRLGAIRVRLVPPGTWDRYAAERLATRGGTPEQYKHPCLCPDLNFVMRFETVCEVEPRRLAADLKLA
jgi:hypothetical protein